MKRKRHSIMSRRIAGATVMVSAMLAGCGGGGSSGDDAADRVVQLQGVVASGKALAGASVRASCAAGSTSATTAASGAYSMQLPAASLPCVLEATSSDGSVVLHSVVAAGTATANVTPLTDLLVAELSGQAPAAFFAGASAATLPAVVTGDGIASAQAAVAGVLKAGGVDTTAAGDYVTGALAAATASNVGNAYDRVLDTLAVMMADAGTSWSSFAAAVAANSPAAAAPGAAASSAAASPPAGMLMHPAAANCESARSGAYRFVSPFEGATAADKTGVGSFDAKALVWSDPETPGDQFTANGPCRFIAPDGSDIVFSPAGIFVVRFKTYPKGSSAAPVWVWAIGFPEQQHALGEIAGSWNMMALVKNDGGSFTGAAASFTLDAKGVFSNITFCQNDATWGVTGADCQPVAEGQGPKPIVPDSSGGFKSSGDGSRYFVFRSGHGDLMLVGVDPDGSVYFATRKQTNVLPAVGAVSRRWSVGLGGISEGQETIASVDTAAGSFVRTWQNIGANNAHPETIFVNNPRDGYNFRPAGSATAADGSTATWNAWTSLSLHGMGVNPFIVPATKQMLFGVLEP